MMEQMDGVALTLADLVVVSDTMGPYALTFQPDGDLDGTIETYALVVMNLLFPRMPFLKKFWILESQMWPMVSSVLLYMEVSVPGVVLDNGTMAVTEEVVAVVLVDCTLDVIPLLSHQEPFAEVDCGFSEAVPQALPSPDPLLAEALHWVSSATGRVNFYSAESEAEVVSPKPRKPKRQARAWRRRAYTYRKRWSTAKAANSCNSVSVVGAPHVGNPPVDVPGSALSRTPGEVRDKLEGEPVWSKEALGAAFAGPQTGPRLGAIAKDMAPPPRTTSQPPLGLLGPLMVADKPKTVLELEEEKGGKELPDQANLARAVLAQSHALTTLVSEIAAAGQDPMTDLSTPGAGTSTRGAQGRARLQSELAMHRGTFHFGSAGYVKKDGPDQQLRDDSRATCGTTYLERFAGYGRLREWGQLQFQVMTALDFLMEDNIPAAKDTIALLAVAIEQGVLDHGKLEIASLLCLQEDVPAGVFMTRQVGSSSRSRSFAPLADQKWITCALAYMKEMDVITSKRLEYVQKPSTVPGPDDAAPKKQPKGAPKKKGGKGQSKGEDEETY